MWQINKERVQIQKNEASKKRKAREAEKREGRQIKRGKERRCRKRTIWVIE
jgi:hypothetical protein